MSDFEDIGDDIEDVTVTGEVKGALHYGDFAKVVFQNVAESYPIEASIVCRYLVTSSFDASSRDWVALCRVGWISPHQEYVDFVWSPLPDSYQSGRCYDNTVTFAASRLPTDDGEFYQFCYVSATGNVRGASTPFQFKPPSPEDFITVQDDDSDMMVIKSRSQALEEDLRQAARENETLIKQVEHITGERDTILSKLLDVEAKLTDNEQELEHARDKLMAAIKDLSKTKESVEHEVNERQSAKERCRALEHDKSSLEESITSLLKEKESLSSSAADKVQQIKKLKETITSLRDDKLCDIGTISALEKDKGSVQELRGELDTQQGTIQGLQRQKQMVQNQLELSERAVARYSRESGEWERRLQEKEEAIRSKDNNIQELKVRITK